MLINAVSASLIRAPDFKECHNPVRVDLIRIADRVATYDPEFVLKVCIFMTTCCTNFLCLVK